MVLKRCNTVEPVFVQDDVIISTPDVRGVVAGEMGRAVEFHKVGFVAANLNAVVDSPIIGRVETDMAIESAIESTGDLSIQMRTETMPYECAKFWSNA